MPQIPIICQEDNPFGIIIQPTNGKEPRLWEHNQIHDGGAVFRVRRSGDDVFGLVKKHIHSFRGRGKTAPVHFDGIPFRICFFTDGSDLSVDRNPSLPD